MKKHIAGTGLLVLIILAGCTGTGEAPVDGGGGADVPHGSVTVNVTDAGFVPATVTVRNGTTVTWVNQRSRPTWPASVIHPTHTRYPGGDYDAAGSYRGSQGCSGPGEQKGHAFDACQGIAPGETWSFTFRHTGTWRYHDHLRPSVTGIVKVVE